MTVLDLFSGIGGFSLAAHRVGFEVIGKAKNDLCSDSHIYRAFDNAINVDVGQWVLSRLKEYITLL